MGIRPPAGESGDGKGAVTVGDGLLANVDVGVAQDIAEQMDEKTGGCPEGIDVCAGTDGLEGSSQGGGDAKGAALLIEETEACGKAVIGGRALVGQFSPGGLFEDSGDEKSTLKPEGIEDQGIGLAAGHGDSSE